MCFSPGRLPRFDDRWAEASLVIIGFSFRLTDAILVIIGVRLPYCFSLRMQVPLIQRLMDQVILFHPEIKFSRKNLISALSQRMIQKTCMERSKNPRLRAKTAGQDAPPTEKVNDII